MTSRGRITIPKVLRERHQLEPGAVVEFIERTPSEVVLRKASGENVETGATRQSRARR